MKTILVTGGAGFIGSNLVASLVARGTHNIVVCDTFGIGEKWRNLSKHAAHEIVLPDEIFGWLKHKGHTLDMVFHLGSVSSTTEKNLDLIIKNNFDISVRLWEWCIEHKMRFVYMSASATYGGGERGFDDSMDLAYLHSLRPLSGYGWSKHLFDVHVANTVHRQEATPPQWVGLKCFNMFGPNEYHKGDQQSVISKMAPHAIQAGNVRLFRSYNPRYLNGAQKRDVIYVKDITSVMLWLLDHPDVSGLFNLGTGTASTFNDMALAIFAAIGKKPNIHYIDMPEDLVSKYQYFTEAKMDRLRAAGYTAPFTPLEDAIRDYVQNYLLKDDPYL